MTALDFVPDTAPTWQPPPSWIAPLIIAGLLSGFLLVPITRWALAHVRRWRARRGTYVVTSVTDTSFTLSNSRGDARPRASMAPDGTITAADAHGLRPGDSIRVIERFERNPSVIIPRVVRRK